MLWPFGNFGIFSTVWYIVHIKKTLAALAQDVVQKTYERNLKKLSFKKYTLAVHRTTSFACPRLTQRDQMRLEKNRQKCRPTRFCQN
jgi:hypothetical protein